LFGLVFLNLVEGNNLRLTAPQTLRNMMDENLPLLRLTEKRVRFGAEMFAFYNYIVRRTYPKNSSSDSSDSSSRGWGSFIPHKFCFVLSFIMTPRASAKNFPGGKGATENRPKIGKKSTIYPLPVGQQKKAEK